MLWNVEIFPITVLKGDPTTDALSAVFKISFIVEVTEWTAQIARKELY